MILVEAKEQPCYALRDRLAAISTLPAVPEPCWCLTGSGWRPPFLKMPKANMPGNSRRLIK
jgi:hypothetical protein